MNEVGSDEGIPTDADAGRLAESMRGELMDDFVGQGAAPGHDADLTRLADVARDDSHLALAGRDESGAIRPDEARTTFVYVRQCARHVEHGNAFGDTDDQLDARIGRLEDRRCGDGRRDVDD